VLYTILFILKKFCNPQYPMKIMVAQIPISDRKLEIHILRFYG